MKGIWKAIVPMVSLVATACGPAAGSTPGPARAEVVFADNCAPCHGADGGGNHDILAPKISGLPSWYVQAQLEKFRGGIRGAHADDIEGLRMRPMSKTIDDTDVSFLGDYVASLPVVDDKIAATGDSAKGKSLYTTCAACHGPEGAGMEALKAPPIANLEAWYIESQLTKFRKGIRGAHPKDTTGAQMAPMAKSLADDQAVTDVAAYITTL